MALRHLMGKDRRQLLFTHAAARVCHRDFHIVGSILGRDVHAAALAGKLTRIVGQRVQHEQREHRVGLDRCRRRLHVERDTLHAEAGLAARHQVEQLLQGEALDVQVQLALA